MTNPKHANLTEHAGPVPGEDDAARAQRLRAQEMSVAGIASELSVSERQVYRLLAAARARVRDRDLEPWSLAASAEDAGTPAMSRYFLEHRESVLFRRGSAAYAWQVHQVSPELSPELVAAFAEMYLNVSRLRGRDRDVQAWILDLALHLRPWSSEKAGLRFRGAVPARDEADLEFAARVAVFLRRIHEHWGGILRPMAPVPDHAGWLAAREAELEREATGGTRTVRPMDAPGVEKPRRRG